jgi:hypothetical protein
VRLFEEVIVHTKNGTSIAGSLRRRHGRWLVLAQARLLDGTGPPVKLDGDVSIPREQVDFAQRAAPPSPDPDRRTS